jgi:hypothetical protein
MSQNKERVGVGISGGGPGGEGSIYKVTTIRPASYIPNRDGREPSAINYPPVKGFATCPACGVEFPVCIDHGTIQHSCGNWVEL